jgi:hypothetical protein
MRLTMSNVRPGSPLLWVHFCYVYFCVLWTAWLVTEQYKEYIALRQVRRLGGGRGVLSGFWAQILDLDCKRAGRMLWVWGFE